MKYLLKKGRTKKGRKTTEKTKQTEKTWKATKKKNEN